MVRVLGPIFKAKYLRKLIFLILFATVLVSTPAIFLQDGFSVETVRDMIAPFGILGPIIFIIATSSTNVIPPLAVTPFWIASVVMFGPILGFWYSFLGNLAGSSINYYIAKIWGRPAVQKAAGKRALDRIDKLPNIRSPFTVFALKFVGGAATDYISYASGLSRVKFIPYLIATTFSILPMMSIGFVLISQASFNSTASTATALGAFYTINYLSTLLLVPVSWHLMGKNAQEIELKREEKLLKKFSKKYKGFSKKFRPN